MEQPDQRLGLAYILLGSNFLLMWDDLGCKPTLGTCCAQDSMLGVEVLEGTQSCTHISPAPRELTASLREWETYLPFKVGARRAVGNRSARS